MSTLGDLIVEHGPFVNEDWLDAEQWCDVRAVNALRDELIELRELTEQIAVCRCSTHVNAHRHVPGDDHKVVVVP